MLKRLCKNLLLASANSLSRDWLAIKSLISFEIRNQNFERAIVHIEKACTLAYTYNFIPDYWDSEIEGFIQTITKAVAKTEIHEGSTISDRVVFFDHFVLENRGFTQQYLNVLISNDIEVLYIIDTPDNYDKKNQIIQTLEQYGRGDIVVLKSSSRIDKLNELLQTVMNFNPSRVFIHTAPWELISCSMAYSLQVNTSIKCYLLNITDHAFWPGITCFEYIIDFRSYGYNINRYLKGKNDEKLIVIPTPPYLQDVVPFQGFPSIPKDSIIGFSGGSYYKIVDKQKTFLNLIRELISKNDNFIFLFACVGGEEDLKQFIRDYKLERSFLLIGSRTDIGEVFKRIHIYFNTYPYGGGMMLQYAVRYKKPIVALWDIRLYHTRLDLVFDAKLSEDHIIVNREKFLTLASELIRNEIIRNIFVKPYGEIENSMARFNTRVKQLLRNEPVDPVAILELVIDQKGVTDFHIEVENTSKHIYTTRIYNILQYKPLKERLGVSFKYFFYRIFKRFNLI